MFHRIDFGAGNNSFSPENLEKMVKFLAEKKVKTLTFWDLKFLEWGLEKPPKKAVILTFDDGYQNHLAAAKILKKWNLRGVFFVISERVGSPDYLNWDEVREISKMGHEIGSHSATHADLTTLSDEKLRAEIAKSKRKIELEIGQKVISFCFPAGKYDTRAIKILRDEKYEFARTTRAGKIFSLNTKFELPATRILPKTGIASLQIWFSDEHNFYSKKDF